MKKVIIISLFGLLVIPTSIVFATSGACSSHLGVNCSYGATYTGKVMCNDGWENSSVYFSDMEECKVICSYPASRPSCNLSDIEQQKQNALGQSSAIQANSGLLGSSFGSSDTNSISSRYDSEYLACQRQWNTYQSKINQYDRCIGEQDMDFEQKEKTDEARIQFEHDSLCVGVNGIGSVWDQSVTSYDSKKTAEWPCYPKISDRHLKCQQSDLHSIYSKDENKCVCTYGFEMNKNSKCVEKNEALQFIPFEKSLTEVCQEVNGKLSLYSDIEKKCICVEGYQLKDNKCEVRKEMLSKTIKETSIETKIIDDSKKSTISSTTFVGGTSSNVMIKKVSWFRRFINWFK